MLWYSADAEALSRLPWGSNPPEIPHPRGGWFMTSWPRLLLVPALLVAAAVALLAGAAVAQPAQEELVGGIIVVIGLLVLASVLAVLPFRVVVAERREVEEQASSQTRLLEDVFSSETATVLLTTDAEGRITRVNAGAEAVL